MANATGTPNPDGSPAGRAAEPSGAPYRGPGRPAERGTMRRRSVLVVTGVLVLLVAGAALADHALRIAAEDRIAQSARSSWGLGDDARVGIAEHRPFLLQVAGGRLDEVTVTTSRMTPAQGDVTDVQVRATGVTIRSPSTADDVMMTGTVPPATVRARLAANGIDADVAVAGGLLRVSGSVLGLPWHVTVAPRADAGRLVVDVTSADIAGVQVGADALPAPVRQAVSALDVSVSGLPAGLALTGAQVVGDGIRVTLTGRDVVLTGS